MGNSATAIEPLTTSEYKALEYAAIAAESSEDAYSMIEPARISNLVIRYLDSIGVASTWHRLGPAFGYQVQYRERREIVILIGCDDEDRPIRTKAGQCWPTMVRECLGATGPVALCDIFARYDAMNARAR